MEQEEEELVGLGGRDAEGPVVKEKFLLKRITWGIDRKFLLFVANWFLEEEKQSVLYIMTPRVCVHSGRASVLERRVAVVVGWATCPSMYSGFWTGLCWRRRVCPAAHASVLYHTNSVRVSTGVST